MSMRGHKMAGIIPSPYGDVGISANRTNIEGQIISGRPAIYRLEPKAVMRLTDY